MWYQPMDEAAASAARTRRDLRKKKNAGSHSDRILQPDTDYGFLRRFVLLLAIRGSGCGGRRVLRYIAYAWRAIWLGMGY